MVLNRELFMDNEKDKYVEDSSGNVAVRVFNTNLLIPDTYDEIELTYVSSGNGVGQIETVVYKSNAVVVGTLTLSYDGSDRLSGVTKT